MFSHVQTLLNLCENLYLMQLMSFLNLKVLKGKTRAMSKRITPHLKFSIFFFLKQKNLKNKQKLQLIWTYENVVKF